MSPGVLVDTSFLYAFYNQDDYLHQKALAGIKRELGLIIPQVVLVETAYLFKERAGVMAAVKFLDTISISQPPLESITYADIARVRDIMSTYADARFDFVDCCIMALAERLNVTQIYTFDRRDFAIFRPQHCSHLELLP